MPETVDHSDPTNVAVKPGWQSTEAWATLIAQVLGAVMFSGVLNPSDPAQAKILSIGGIALSILSALGYQVTRAQVKNTAVMGATTIAVAKLQAAAASAAVEEATLENPPKPSP
jgi:hypothetical protein